MAQFKNATEQMIYYIKRFAHFCNDVVSEEGEAKPEDRDRLQMILDHIPEPVYVNYVMEVKEKLGPSLDARELTGVAKLVAMYSQSKSATGLSDEITKFIERLKSRPGCEDKFFSYWKVINTIISSTLPK